LDTYRTDLVYTTVETVYTSLILLVTSQIVNAVSRYQDSMVDPGSFLGLMAVYCISQLQDPSQSAPEPFQHALWKCPIATNPNFFFYQVLYKWRNLLQNLFHGPKEGWRGNTLG